MITLHCSYKFRVTSQRYCSCKDKNNDPKCTCIHTCLGGLSLRGTQKGGSFHQVEGSPIRNCHSPGKEIKALSTWKSPWVHPSLKGRFPITELLFQGKLRMISVRGPIYNLVGLGFIIAHSQGQETSLGMRPLTGSRSNLLTKGICTSCSFHCGGAGRGRNRGNGVPATTGTTRYQPRWDRCSWHWGRINI